MGGWVDVEGNWLIQTELNTLQRDGLLGVVQDIPIQ